MQKMHSSIQTPTFFPSLSFLCLVPAVETRVLFVYDELKNI